VQTGDDVEDKSRLSGTEGPKLRTNAITSLMEKGRKKEENSKKEKPGGTTILPWGTSCRVNIAKKGGQTHP